MIDVKAILLRRCNIYHQERGYIYNIYVYPLDIERERKKTIDRGKDCNDSRLQARKNRIQEGRIHDDTISRNMSD